MNSVGLILVVWFFFFFFFKHHSKYAFEKMGLDINVLNNAVIFRRVYKCDSRGQIQKHRVSLEEKKNYIVNA